MSVDTKHKDLEGLRIDRSAVAVSDGPAPWAKSVIIGGIVVVVLLGIATLAYRFLFASAPVVEVVRATAEGGNVGGSVVLTATGYVIPHHRIEANSKVTGRVAWIGVEKGDQVKEGQVLVRLEDQEFKAQYDQARGAADSARAQLEQLEHGSRPEEVEQAANNLSEARATEANDKINLDRTKNLFDQGVVSKQALDDASAKYEASQQRVHSLEQSHTLAKIGPRAEEIARAKGALTQAEGQAAYQKSLLDATVIRAPITGTILERSVEKGELLTGQFASAARPVFALADLNDIQADLDISQDDFAKLTPRQKAIVTVDAFPDLKWEGAIAEVSPEANRQKATIEVKVQILNPDSHLRPEMNTTVRFVADENRGPTTQQSLGAVVPSAAIRDADGNKYVFIVFQGKAMKRDVKVLSQRSAGALVSGLNGGESVITTAPEGLKHGDKIKIKGQS
jgi:RND family efflux transporter MFP subunit